MSNKDPSRSSLRRMYDLHYWSVQDIDGFATTLVLNHTKPSTFTEDIVRIKRGVELTNEITEIAQKRAEKDMAEELSENTIKYILTLDSITDPEAQAIIYKIRLAVVGYINMIDKNRLLTPHEHLGLLAIFSEEINDIYRLFGGMVDSELATRKEEQAIMIEDIYSYLGSGLTETETD